MPARHEPAPAEVLQQHERQPHADDRQRDGKRPESPARIGSVEEPQELFGEALQAPAHERAERRPQRPAQDVLDVGDQLAREVGRFARGMQVVDESRAHAPGSEQGFALRHQVLGVAAIRAQQVEEDMRKTSLARSHLPG